MLNVQNIKIVTSFREQLNLKLKKKKQLNETYVMNTHISMNIYMREKRRPFELYPIRTYVIIQLRHDSLNKTPRRMKKKEKEKETFVKIKTIPNDQPLRSIQLSSKERNILANDNEQTSSRFDKKYGTYRTTPTS